MEQPAPTPGRELFAPVPERNTADNFLRTTQQHHVALSSMADTKANIIITCSSIVLTLGGFTLLALLLAILAVLPKYLPLKLQGEKIPPNFNLLFFGHFSELPRERYLEEMARVMMPDGSLYATWAADIYSLGSYLGHHKYRYLRLSYLSFLAGFVLACVEQGWRLMFH